MCIVFNKLSSNNGHCDCPPFAEGKHSLYTRRPGIGRNSFRYRIVLLLGVFSVLAVLAGSAGARDGASRINGLYALCEAGKRVPQAVLENTNVDGLALRYFWDSLEPEEGVFDWSSLDREVAAAQSYGKKVSLSVAAGAHTPSWVYAAGAAEFFFTWSEPWGRPICSKQRLPVPWHPVYLTKWKEFVRALGTRYDSNPTLVYVKITGINSTTHETLLPHSRSRRIAHDSVSCSSEDDVLNWQRLGYTRAKVESAWRTIAENFAQSFPHKKLGVMIVPKGFPPINDSGELIGEKRADHRVAEDLIKEGVAAYDGRFVLQNNGLSAFWNWEPPLGSGSKLTIGYQMLWSATGDPQCRMNHRERPCDPHAVLKAAVDRGLDSGARFLEIYIPDVLNPQLQDVLAKAHRIPTR